MANSVNPQKGFQFHNPIGMEDWGRYYNHMNRYPHNQHGRDYAVIEEELRKQREELDTRNRQMFEMQRRYDDIVAGLRQQVNGLQDTINIKHYTLVEKEHMYKGIIKKLEDEKAELNKDADSEIRKLQSQNRDVRNRLEKTRRDLEHDIRVVKEKLRKQNANVTGIEKLEARISDLRAELKGKSEAFRSLESLNKTLVDKELKSLQELKEARKESVTLRTELEEKSKAVQSLESLTNTLLRKELRNKQERQEAIALRAELVERSDYLESLNNTLILKELNSREELQEARSESITSLKEMLNSRTTLIIRRLGEIDRKAFQEACMEKYPKDEWEENSAKLCSLWEEYLRDPNWHPFKTVKIKGKLEEIVNEDDVKLKELRDEYGEAVYSTVANALMEMNEHNPSGRYLISEVWNPREGRIATMKEIVQYLVKQVKTRKRKR